MSGVELLGVAAAAEQFGKVALETAKFIKSVVGEIQDAPARIQQQIERIDSLASLATQIKGTKTLQTVEFENILTRCESHIRELQTLLDKISFEPTNSLPRKTSKAICSLNEAENITRLFNILDHEYSTLNTLINL